MRVEHVMSLNPVACEAGQPVAEAARLMRDRKVGCVVVLDRGRVVGLVTDRLLCTRALAEAVDPEQTPVADVMLREVACVSPDDSIFAAVDTLRSAHLARRVPVIGPRRELLGLVSIADVAVVAKDLIDAVLAEETQHSLKRARALTGGKRIVKRIRRPTKAGRLPRESAPAAKRRASRPGVQRNPPPGSRRRRQANPALRPTWQAGGRTGTRTLAEGDEGDGR